MNSLKKNLLSIFSLKKGKIFIMENHEELIKKIKYNEILRIVRNSEPLNNDQLFFVKTLNKDQLLEIIEINKIYIDFFNKSL